MVCHFYFYFLPFGLCTVAIRVVAAMRTVMGHPATSPLLRSSPNTIAPYRVPSLVRSLSPSLSLPLPTSHHTMPSVPTKPYGCPCSAVQAHSDTVAAATTSQWHGAVVMQWHSNHDTMACQQW